MKKRTGKFFTPTKIIIGTLVFVIATVTLLQLTNAIHLFHSGPKANFPTTPTRGGGSVYSQKGQANNNSAGSNSSTTSPSTNAPINKTPGKNTTNTYLITPWGNFVSNHHPGQNGTPTTETSVCNTTQGASCYISFSNGQATFSLPSQVTGSNGATFWSNWSISGVGLTQGNWKVTATATLNGQSKTASDPMELVVQ